MRQFYFIILFLALGACRLFENEDQTRKAIEQIERKNICVISYETYIEYDKSEIKLFHDCDLQDDWEKGMFTYSVYQDFKRLGIYYDRLTLISENPNDSIYSRRAYTMKRIEKKMNSFLLHLDAFNKNKLSEIYAKSSNSLKSEIPFEMFKRNFGSEKIVKPFKLIGFKLYNFKNKRRIYFCSKNGANTLIFSYELNPYRKEIQSIQFF